MIKQKNYFYILITLLTLCSTSVIAQDPSIIVDTLKLNNKAIIVFSNNQWMYLDEYTILYPSLNADAYKNNMESNCIYGYLNEKVKPKFDFSTVDPTNFTMPRKGGRLFRGYGKGHAGLDIGLKMGDSVVAAFDGKIRFAQYHRNGYGFLVIVRHSNGLETWYSHLSKLSVKEGQTVRSGELIGQGGMTGRASSPHLHLEFRYHDVSMDPLKFIDYEKATLVASLQKNAPTVASTTAEEDNKAVAQATTHPKETKKIVIKEKAKYHTIKQGDTLYGISKRYNTTIKELCKTNGIAANSVIQPGMKIKVPKSS